MEPYDCIFINGDSYSAPIQNSQVYGDFLSSRLAIPVFNFAVPGSTNQRILRSSIEYISQLKHDYKNPLIIIGWSFVRRLEVWYYGSNPKILSRIPDIKHMTHSRLITLDHLINAGEATVEQKCLVNEDLFVHKQLTDFYTNLYMFGNFLQCQGLNYLFFSAARNTDCPVHCFPYLESLDQVTWVLQNQRAYKLHEFCIMDWAKDNDVDSHPITGHLSENGHEKFSNFILETMLG